MGDGVPYKNVGGGIIYSSMDSLKSLSMTAQPKKISTSTSGTINCLEIVRKRETSCTPFLLAVTVHFHLLEPGLSPICLSQTSITCALLAGLMLNRGSGCLSYLGNLLMTSHMYATCLFTLFLPFTQALPLPDQLIPNHMDSSFCSCT